MRPANDNVSPTNRTLIKLAIDLGPLLVFFVVTVWGGMIAATAAFMVAFFMALGASYWLERKISLMTLITGAVVAVFGGLTLYLNDTTFIKLKPTLIYGIFATILLGGYLTGRPLIRYLFEHAFQLDNAGWRVLTLRWGFFFIALAILNEIVWRNFSENVWAAFKLFGFLPLILVFGALQFRLIERHQLGPHNGAPADDQNSAVSPGGLEKGTNTVAERTDQ